MKDSSLEGIREQISMHSALAILLNLTNVRQLLCSGENLLKLNRVDERDFP
jgi:hypothetical protein